MLKYVFSFVILFVLLLGCSKYRPLMTTTNFPSDGSKYRILGRVELKKKVNKSGFTLLLEEAIKKYPEADDAVNIVIDEYETKSILFWKTNYKYHMSGVAIDYLD